MEAMATVRRLTPARLIELVGDQAAATLMAACHGRRIPEATPLHVKHAERDRRIRAWVKHHGYASAAEEFGLSERQVRRIVHGY